MSIGIPVKLLHEAVGHIVTIELNTGEIYRGKLLAGEDNMNCQLTEITFTARNGHVSKLEQVYIRGSKVRFFIVPDMLRYSPMFVKKSAVEKGILGGKSSILRAQAATRGRGSERGRGGDRGRGRFERSGGSDRSGERGMKSSFGAGGMGGGAGRGRF